MHTLTFADPWPLTATVTATPPHNASPELTATTAYSMVAASRQVAALKHGRGQVRGWPLNCDVFPLNIKGASRFLRKWPSATLDIEPPEALWPETKGQAASLARIRGHPLHGAGSHQANSGGQPGKSVLTGADSNRDSNSSHQRPPAT